MQICKSLMLVPAILGLILLSCQQAETEQNQGIESQTAEVKNTSRHDSTIALPSYTYTVFETDDLGWGYKIFDNGTLIINQPHIPAVTGNRGFSTSDKAEVTANFAIHKMKLGFIPPTISVVELDSLGVLN